MKTILYLLIAVPLLGFIYNQVFPPKTKDWSLEKEVNMIGVHALDMKTGIGNIIISEPLSAKEGK